MSAFEAEDIKKGETKCLYMVKSIILGLRFADCGA